jgi:hypothetical protein
MMRLLRDLGEREPFTSVKHLQVATNNLNATKTRRTVPLAAFVLTAHQSPRVWKEDAK